MPKLIYIIVFFIICILFTTIGCVTLSDENSSTKQVSPTQTTSGTPIQGKLSSILGCWRFSVSGRGEQIFRFQENASGSYTITGLDPSGTLQSHTSKMNWKETGSSGYMVNLEVTIHGGPNYGGDLTIPLKYDRTKDALEVPTDTEKIQFKRTSC